MINLITKKKDPQKAQSCPSQDLALSDIYNIKSVIKAAIAMNTTRSLKELSFLASFYSKGSTAVLLLYPFNPSHRSTFFNG